MAVRATLKDVAAAAGVSVTTASRSLSDQAAAYRISDATAASVKEAAQRLQFQPSRVARSLRFQKSGLVGIVVPDIANPFFSAIAAEITRAAEQAGRSVLIANSEEETRREIQLVSELQAREVEALVVCPVGVKFAHLSAVQQAETPLVLVDRTFPETEFLQVTSQHEAGAEKAIAMLTSQGHRRIGVLQGLRGTLPNEARLAGSRRALQRVNAELPEEFIHGDNFTEQSGYQSALALLQANDNLTALFAFSMPNAFGALRAALELGISVPNEVSLVAFDDSPYADLMHVPVSTVSQDVAALGKQAGQLMVKRLGGARSPRKTLHEIKVRAIERHSIKKVNLS